MDGSPQCGLLLRNHPMAPRCRRVGAVHSIKNGPDALEMGCLYYPPKQTSVSHASDSADALEWSREKSQAWLLENR
jgi:hypothetical protein